MVKYSLQIFNGNAGRVATHLVTYFLHRMVRAALFMQLTLLYPDLVRELVVCATVSHAARRALSEQYLFFMAPCLPTPSKQTAQCNRRAIHTHRIHKQPKVGQNSTLHRSPAHHRANTKTHETNNHTRSDSHQRAIKYWQ